jgi:two-component system response regulator HydG/two-component system response regulator AtoC
MGAPGISLLLVSQAASDRRNLSTDLARAGLAVMDSDSADDALRLFEVERPSLVCIHHPSSGAFDGLDLVRRIRARDSFVPILVTSERRSEELLLQALRAGVSDFLIWPFPLKEFLDWVLARVGKGLQRAGSSFRGMAGAGGREADPFIGEAPVIRAVRRQILTASRVTCNVLLTGESGTGKELVAELIHRSGPRRDGPFVPVSCAAIPEALFESEMFGVTRGAFTGAYANRDGKLKQADGGTLLLDEIGEMPLHAQAKLLRAIERKEVQRLGEHRTSRLDIRVIAATNQDLEELVRQQRFRPDLYFRLNVLRIGLPPLRERPSDIPRLVTHFLKELAGEMGESRYSLDSEVLDLLCRYAWPGNVRELRNVLEATVARASTAVLGREDLPLDFRLRFDQVEGLGQTERDRLLSILEAVSWDKSRAARELRWSRATLYRKLARYSLVPPTSARSRR